ncbi:RES domain-containing protein [Muricauda oceani]|uniref:RES domain-containing protein n=1 Tax=Flagellimonas oceani TaxID=2698672 RepID=A0A6G7IZZ9_9FLAO|nr:RES domain-containing protein [Allomuricauda oceani]QII44126.1 RES domain-containing protein [Allomuricauda oceani]
MFEDISSRSPLGFGIGGARWNHSGIPLIYVSNFSSIVINEILSIKGSVVAKSNWILATLEIDESSILFLRDTDMPKDWNHRPSGKSTKDIGSKWAADQKSVCLGVPSARLNLSAYPTEHNLLINPLHPDFGKVVSMEKSESFSFQLNKN